MTSIRFDFIDETEPNRAKRLDSTPQSAAEGSPVQSVGVTARTAPREGIRSGFVLPIDRDED